MIVRGQATPSVATHRTDRPLALPRPEATVASRVVCSRRSAVESFVVGDRSQATQEQPNDHKRLANPLGIGQLGVRVAAQAAEAQVKHLRTRGGEHGIGDDLLDAVVVTTGTEAYRRPDGIAVVPAALLGP